MNFFAELKRRKVFKVGAAYLVAAWLAVQAASIGFPAFDAPPWVLRVFILVILLGFPLALVLAWVFDVTSQGVKLDVDAHGSKRLFAVVGVLVALALGWYFYGQPSFRKGEVGGATVDQHSIAVLPFVNMSADKDNEFFSDGLSEEILNSLARIDGMLVVGRTSSFQFKGKNEDLRSVGEKLGVANVLEGSVRREGDRARITAQLIRASDGYHLWSETYDRTVKDSLAVQLDIAEQVAGVLDVVLDDKQRAHMRDAGVKNVDAFIAYQKGWKLYIDGHRNPDLNLIDTLRLANVEFDKAIALEPDFSFAYFAEADFYEHILIADDRSQAERLDAQRSTLRTLELAAEHSPDVQQRDLALAERQMLSDDWQGLAERIDTALRQPGCSAPNWMPVFASAFGYSDLIENLGARVNACDPLNGINFNTRAWAARATGHAERALSIEAAAAKASGRTGRGGSDPIALTMLGRIPEAQKVLASVDPAGEGYYVAQLIVGRASGENPASLHARLRDVDRSHSKLKIWAIADAVEASLSGDRAEANRQAAVLDARPAGGLLLAILVTECQCGAPFDLDATPHFKARLAESGLHWPPPPTIAYPSLAGNTQP